MVHEEGTAPTTLLNTTIVGQPWGDNFQLGVGVDAVTGQLRSPALEKFTLRPSKNQRTEYTYSLVESRQDLEQLLETSLKGSYNIEGVKVSGSTSFLEKVTVSELAVTIVAKVSIEDSEYSLAPEYRLAITPGPDFRERHGDYFVAGYRAGSSLYAVYQCRFTDTTKRQKFSAALAAEVPQVLSVEGSATFERIAGEHGAQVDVEVVVDGVRGTMPSPKDGWTPGSILSDVIPWFNDHIEPTPRESYLEHYRMIDPDVSGHVPIAPAVFADLGYLYTMFWTARSQVKTCPDFGRRLVSDPFLRLEKDVEAHQASLATDPERVRELTADVRELLGTLTEIAHRQAFYTQVVKAHEPPEKERHDADGGTVLWSYGYQEVTRPGVDVSSTTIAWSAPDKFMGWREHMFTYQNTSRIVVGWQVVCCRDENGGDWEKRSSRIVGTPAGAVWVKSDYSRYTSWKVVWYTVDASLYPAGPWTAGLAHSSGFSVVPAASPQGSLEQYWSPERMRAAEPVELASVGVPAAGLGDGGTTSTRVVEPSDQLAVEVTPSTEPVADPSSYPARTVGKLFFTMGDRDFTATAVVVHRTGIMTAAHCLVADHEASNIVFAPAFTDGDFPFGIWGVEAFAWPDEWKRSRSVAYDLGFARIGPRADGRTVGDVVGWVGIRLGTEVRRWDDVGYPAVATPRFPFDGRRPWQSRGARIGAPRKGVVAKADDLTHGASGGPWFPVDEPTMVNGLLSGGSGEPGIVVGPEFAAWVATFYHHVFG